MNVENFTAINPFYVNAFTGVLARPKTFHLAFTSKILVSDLIIIGLYDLSQTDEIAFLLHLKDHLQSLQF